MADSLAARRLVREHLETHFEEYLSSVASYLQQAYPEFQLSSEVSEEMAATVIVRVSHANPEPTNIEKALTDGADEVIRSRKPRLSQAKLLEDMNGPLRSEFPRVLPSLRLIQTLSRAPANGDGEMRNLGVAPGSRLVLANPPIDLGASIGLGGAETSNSEPGFGGGETSDEWGGRGGGAPRVGLSAEEVRRLDEDDEAVLAPDLGAGREVTLAESFVVEPKFRDPEDDPFDLDSRPTITRVVSDQAPAVDRALVEPPVPVVPGASNRLVLRTFDEPSDRFEVPSLRQEGVERVTATAHGQTGGLPPLAVEKQSSVPPTQESIIPGISSEAQLGALGLGVALASDIEKPRTRRKPTSRSKKPAAKHRATSKNTAAQPRKSAARATKPSTAKAKVKDTAQASKPPRDIGRQYVADDLAVVAMIGFPTNPKRAAKLCVTAMAEDLGLDEHADLSKYAAVVAEALDVLRLAWTSEVPPDAHLEWQKVARQATLRAFLATRP